MYKLIRYFQKISILIGMLAVLLIAVPMIFGIKPYVVLSGSMEPKIKTGSMVYINKRIPATSINVGDIIGFKTGENMVVTHRAVDITSEGFTTKGDANENTDGKIVTYENYIGKTMFSIPYIGRAISFFRTQKGIFWLAVIIGLNILCTMYDKKIYKEDYEEEGKDEDRAKEKNTKENITVANQKDTQMQRQNIELMYNSLKEKTQNSKRHAFENYTPKQEMLAKQKKLEEPKRPEYQKHKGTTSKKRVFKKKKAQRGKACDVKVMHTRKFNHITK